MLKIKLIKIIRLPKLKVVTSTSNLFLFAADLLKKHYLKGSKLQASRVQFESS